MMKKICPVCDLPVNKYNYCTHCKRRVRRPVLWNADYYLNERPPALSRDERNPQRSSEPLHQTPDLRENQEKRRPAGLPASGGPVHSSGPAAGPAQPQTAKKKGFASAAGIAALAMFLVLNVLPPAFRALFTDHVISGINETVSSYDNSGYREFDEEEVSEAGERCNGNTHFPVDGREIAASMRQYVTDSAHGYWVDVEDTYSDNYGFEDETGLTTYYETTKSIYLKDDAPGEETSGDEASGESASDEDYAYQYVDVNYDTATGEVHYYASSLKNDQASLDYLEEFLKLTEGIVGISGEESSVSQIMEQAGTGILQEEGAYILEGLFDISIYRNEDEVTVFVYYNDPQFAEDQEL